MLIIQIGDDKASNAYIKGKIKDVEELGHRAVLMKYSNNTTVDEVYKFLQDHASAYDGIILQEPAIFSPISCRTKSELINLIPDYKDIDGFKKTSCHKPATPRGIMDYAAAMGHGDLRGKVVAVVGKGKLVGEPIVPMLMKKGATVISCNSTTPDLREMLKQAHIVIAATGVRGLIQDDMIEDGTFVIDAGISVDENGKLHGDCDPALYDRENVDITPVPGGVGLLTRLALMKNFLGK
jgi:methylenetetrahydrofolate dehydrogenase (NADP+)/methenyltetrahydrofolate cyclohydrolase